MILTFEFRHYNLDFCAAIRIYSVKIIQITIPRLHHPFHSSLQLFPFLVE